MITNEGVKLIHGDCLEVLKGMPDNSVDSIVTDPPYGLSFMGKKWDYDVPEQAIWEECLRVLKPGGHLLAFAGTRTQHRMAVRIEDAGFEIRDMIAWVYGCLSDDSEVLTRDGWERYNTSRHKEILAYDAKNDVYQWEKPTRWNEYRVESDTAYRIKSDQTDQIVSRGHRCLVERGGVLAFVSADELAGMERVPYLQDDVFTLPQGCGELLLADVLRQGKGLAEATLSKRQGQEVSSKGFGWTEESGVEGRVNVLQEEGQVRRPVDQVRPLSCGVHGDGSQGRLRHGASSACGAGTGPTAVAERVRASHQPRRDGQPAGEPDAVRIECGSQAVRTRPSYRTTLATVTPVEYTGLIFCPTVSTGAFVARRNGKVFVTGNSGFPKSMDVSKAIDKMDAADARRERQLRFTEWMRSTGLTSAEINRITDTNMGSHYTTAASQPSVATREHFEKLRPHFGVEVPEWVEQLVDERTVESENFKRREVVGRSEATAATGGVYGEYGKGFDITAPATDAASKWQGWGTALKPALEPITVARKPFKGTVAANVLEWGTGAINIDGGRVVGGERPLVTSDRRLENNTYGAGLGGSKSDGITSSGRWPANLIHDGSDELTELIGGAARFFYCAKASKKDRGEGNNHPTVKPTDLMAYLCRLVTPPGGVVLDPFMGSGSTGKAAMREGFRFIGIEMDAEYLAIAEARITHEARK